MTQKRWVPVAALALGLFVINVVARLVIRFGHGNAAAENRASIVMFATIGLALAAATFVWAQRYRPANWLPRVAAAAIAAMLLTVLVGPLISGDSPFSGGAGNFFAQVWLYSGFAIVGTLLGYWLATALGRDYRSRTLSAYARARAIRPRRVVRR